MTGHFLTGAVRIGGGRLVGDAHPTKGAAPFKRRESKKTRFLTGAALIDRAARIQRLHSLTLRARPRDSPPRGRALHSSIRPEIHGGRKDEKTTPWERRRERRSCARRRETTTAAHEGRRYANRWAMPILLMR